MIYFEPFRLGRARQARFAASKPYTTPVGSKTSGARANLVSHRASSVSSEARLQAAGSDGCWPSTVRNLVACYLISCYLISSAAALFVLAKGSQGGHVAAKFLPEWCNRLLFRRRASTGEVLFSFDRPLSWMSLGSPGFCRFPVSRSGLS